MHDGYLFTLGVCCSTSANNPALMLLDTLLGALPPVKRAAFLSDVGAPDHQAGFDDQVLPAIVADLCDAELLIVVTPVSSDALPDRLTAVLHQAAPLAHSGALREKMVLLVGIADSNEKNMPFAQLQHFCITAGMTLTTAVVVRKDVALQPGTLKQLRLAAQQAYAQCRMHIPEALP